MNKSNVLYQQDLDYINSLPGLERLDNKSILITGSTGLIGTCMIDAIMKRNADTDSNIKVIAVGRSKEKAKKRFEEYFGNPCFAFIEQDVRDAFPEGLSVDYVIPLASNTHPLAYSRFPVETIEINVKGAENALKKARACGAMVLYPSSVEIYGNGQEDFDEGYTGKLNLSTSRSCYTESKRVGEALCQSYCSEYQVNCVIARLCRVFGPTMDEHDSKASSQFILKSLAGEDIVLKSKGDQLFSYIYVADAVQALLFLLINGESGQAYNIASSTSNVRLLDFAQECADNAGTKVIFDIPSESEKQGYSIATKAILNTEKINRLGWQSNYGFKTAVRRTISCLQ